MKTVASHVNMWQQKPRFCDHEKSGLEDQNVSSRRRDTSGRAQNIWKKILQGVVWVTYQVEER